MSKVGIRFLVGATALVFAGAASAQMPTVAGVGNGASFDARLAPGAIAAVFGSNFGNGGTGSVTVTVAGIAAATLIVTPAQVNVELPVDAPIGPTTLTVTVGGLTSTPFPITLDAYAPGIDTTNNNIALCLHQDNSAVSPTSPAAPGEAVHCYAIGLGPTNPTVPTGVPATGIVNTTTTPIVTVGGAGAIVVFSGLASNYVGLYQVILIVPTGLAAGNQPLVFQIGGKISNTALLPVNPSAPTPIVASVVNGASFDARLAPGTNSSIFGSNFGSGGAASVTVTVAGKSAYVLYASPNQINLELPVDAPIGPTTITVAVGGLTSAPFNITLDDYAPGLIVTAADQTAQCTKQDNSSVAANNPATTGDVLTCYAVGLGPTNPPVATGQPANGLVVTAATPVVTLGGQSAAVLYSGLAPGFIGLYQINLIVPLDLSSGSQPLAVQIGGRTSNTAFVPLAVTGLAFYPVTPCRIADTRGNGFTGNFGPPRPLAQSTRDIPVLSSSCNIPPGAKAYSLNVTVVPPAPLIYLSIWPTGVPQPFVSTLNSFDGQVVANAAIVPAGVNGSISVFVSDDSDFIIDINGYFAPPAAGGLAFYPVTPCRLADTRGNGFTTPFGPPQMAAGSTHDFPLTGGSCQIPTTVKAYSLNMTVVPPGPLIYLTTWPADQTQPLVSTLNSFNGRVVANAAIVPAAANGDIKVFVSDATDLIIDINGYFAPPGSPGALYFYAATPCRIADTRGGYPQGFGGPIMAGGESRPFPIQSSSCGLPATAQAYSLNMTVVPPGPLIYLTTWPTGQLQPLVSTLNSFNGTVVANAAIVPAGTNGAISVFVSDPTQVIIDVNGYFAQ